MSTKENTNKARSRRERPAKPALTRQGIIDAALAIMNSEGLGKVTMRRIATELDTGASSLYVYISDTEDLHAQLLDALLGSVNDAPVSKDDWRKRLKHLLTQYGIVLFNHPEIARMAMSTMPSGPQYLSLVDRILGLLQEGGVADGDAAWAVDLLMLQATAHAVEHSNWQASPKSADDFSTLSLAVATVDAQAHPHIARLGQLLMSGGPERFQWGLDVLINGVLQTPRPKN